MIVWFPDPSCVGGAREGGRKCLTLPTKFMVHGVWDVNYVEPFDRSLTSREVNKLSMVNLLVCLDILRIQDRANGYLCLAHPSPPPACWFWQVLGTKHPKWNH